MKIQKSFDDANSFDALLQLAEKAQPKLSFLGKRYVCVKGYTGTIKLNALINKTLSIGKQYPFSNEESSLGLKLVQEIDRIVDTSSAQYKTSNLVTSLMCFLREIIPYSNPKSRWDIMCRSGFEENLFRGSNGTLPANWEASLQPRWL